MRYPTPSSLIYICKSTLGRDVQSFVDEADIAFLQVFVRVAELFFDFPMNDQASGNTKLIGYKATIVVR